MARLALDRDRGRALGRARQPVREGRAQQVDAQDVLVGLAVGDDVLGTSDAHYRSLGAEMLGQGGGDEHCQGEDDLRQIAIS